MHFFSWTTTTIFGEIKKIFSEIKKIFSEIKKIFSVIIKNKNKNKLLTTTMMMTKEVPRRRKTLDLFRGNHSRESGEDAACTDIRENGRRIGGASAATITPSF